MIPGDVITAEAVRCRRRHRVIDERDQRERFHCGVVDRNFVRRSEMLQYEHVGICEEGIEAAGHQDRQRSEQPSLEIIGPWSWRDAAGESVVDEKELSENGQPYRYRGH